jgi:hypothetical protein
MKSLIPYIFWTILMVICLVLVLIKGTTENYILLSTTVIISTMYSIEIIKEK